MLMPVHSPNRVSLLLICMALLFGLVLSGCSDEEEAQHVSAQPGERTLVLGAYSVVKDAMKEIIPAFQAEWKQQTGETIHFQESYEASGTQARAIAGGFEADVTLLAMEGDIDKLVRGGLVDAEWTVQPYGGMITRSIVVLGTREGNPKGIRDFEDLTRLTLRCSTLIRKHPAVRSGISMRSMAQV
ncbi:sulfate and thiosulfate binding protein CysP [Paenibacillus sp. JCM 10914]|nr:sulfate and thiosulfate binding protein CysP [Paenibacillus sp. JCM 10914]